MSSDSHRIETATENSEAEDPYNSPILCGKTVHCSRHSHSFCQNINCKSMPICDECLLTEHRIHLDDIKVIDSYITAALEKSTEFEKVTKQLEKLKGISVSVNASQITQLFDALKHSINNRIDQIRDFMLSKSEEFANDVSLNFNRLDLYSKGLKEALTFFQSASRTPLGSEIFKQLIDNINNKLKEDISIDQGNEMILKLKQFNHNCIHMYDALGKNFRNVANQFASYNPFNPNFTMSPLSIPGEDTIGAEFQTLLMPRSSSTADRTVEISTEVTSRASLNNLATHLVFETPTRPSSLPSEPSPSLLDLKLQHASKKLLDYPVCDSSSGFWNNYFSRTPLPDNLKIQFLVDKMVYLNYTCVNPQILFGVCKEIHLETSESANKFIGSNACSWSFGCSNPDWARGYPSLTSGKQERICGKYHNGELTSYGTFFKEGSTVEMYLDTDNGKKSMTFKIDGRDFGVCYDNLPMTPLFLAIGLVGNCKVIVKKAEKFT